MIFIDHFLAYIHIRCVYSYTRVYKKYTWVGDFDTPTHQPTNMYIHIVCVHMCNCTYLGAWLLYTCTCMLFTSFACFWRGWSHTLFIKANVSEPCTHVHVYIYMYIYMCMYLDGVKSSCVHVHVRVYVHVHKCT